MEFPSPMLLTLSEEPPIAVFVCMFLIYCKDQISFEKIKNLNILVCIGPDLKEIFILVRWNEWTVIFCVVEKTRITRILSILFSPKSHEWKLRKNKSIPHITFLYKDSSVQKKEISRLTVELPTINSKLSLQVYSHR